MSLQGGIIAYSSSSSSTRANHAYATPAQAMPPHEANPAKAVKTTASAPNMTFDRRPSVDTGVEPPVTGIGDDAEADADPVVIECELGCDTVKVKL